MAVPAPCGRADGPIGAAGSEDAGDADVEVRGEDNTGVEVDGSACVRSVAGSVDSHSSLIASHMASTIAQSASLTTMMPYGTTLLSSVDPHDVVIGAATGQISWIVRPTILTVTLMQKYMIL